MTTDADDPWQAYYDKVAPREPRELFRRVMAMVTAGGGASPGLAIDLGCGDGTETMALLAAGWNVLAIDASPVAIERVLAGARRLDPDRLYIQQASFGEAILPAADLIYAGLSLPFCPPDDFPVVWAKIRGALRPGARLAAHFFGPRDSWAGNAAMSFHSAGDLRALLQGLLLDHWQEVEEDRPSVFEAMKHHHYFEVIARRPAPPP